MIDPQPMTVEQLLSKLRGMLGHLTRRDRDTVTTAIEAIFELSKRLHEATTGIVDDGAKPVTAEQVAFLLDRAHAEYGDRIAGAQSKMRLQERLLEARDAALANDREPQTVTLEWDELRALLELFGPTRKILGVDWGLKDTSHVRGLHIHSVTAEHPDTGALITKEFPSPIVTLDTTPCPETKGCLYTVGHGGECLVGVDSIDCTACGRRCELHDECELACVLPAGHDVEEGCRCAIAVRALAGMKP